MYGIVANTLTYTGSAAIASTSANYISMLGGSGGLQWNMSAVIAGTFKMPIGPAGTVNGWRPVTLITSASTTANILFNFINHDGGASQSATNVPTTGNNRTSYIASVNVLSGSLPL